MRRIPIAAVLTLVVGVGGSPVMASGPGGGAPLQFDDGIGVDPVAGIDASGNPILNVVQGVNPGGRPWVIEDLRVTIRADGRINARGEGLLLSATNNIGTIGGVTEVAATLFCDGAQPSSSVPVPLDSAGDFEIRGMLTPPPSSCTTPVLLIRNAPAGVLGSWFAAGVLRD